jgi:hypothetical protein
VYHAPAARMAYPFRSVALVSLLLALSTGKAHALDKQGAAHSGKGAGAEAGDFAISGAVMMGVSLINNSYAARPDNTGLALMRYAGHVDIDLLGPRLSIPVDVNMFSDKELAGLDKLTPSELDVIVGVTSTWEVGSGATELGARIERDQAVDRDGKPQTYADVRARYVLSLAHASDRFAARFPGLDLSGWATLGWFAYNKTYFARPDNTGLALFRYALHTELSIDDHQVAFAADTTFFTDKEAENVLRPSELDLTLELIGRRGRYELHFAFEQDMPVDTDTRIQRFLYVLAACAF